VGVSFLAPVQTVSGANPVFCSTGTGIFPAVNHPRSAFDPSPPRFKEELSSNSTLPLVLHGLFRIYETWLDGQPSEFFLSGLRKLKQQAKKCIELCEENVE
jgi:hypothetical protein